MTNMAAAIAASATSLRSRTAKSGANKISNATIEFERDAPIMFIPLYQRNLPKAKFARPAATQYEAAVGVILSRFCASPNTIDEVKMTTTPIIDEINAL